MPPQRGLQPPPDAHCRLVVPSTRPSSFPRRPRPAPSPPHTQQPRSWQRSWPAAAPWRSAARLVWPGSPQQQQRCACRRGQQLGPCGWWRWPSPLWRQSSGALWTGHADGWYFPPRIAASAGSPPCIEVLPVPQPRACRVWPAGGDDSATHERLSEPRRPMRGGVGGTAAPPAAPPPVPSVCRWQSPFSCCTLSPLQRHGQ